MTAIKQESTVTCPHCGFQKSVLMPTNACVLVYECKKCGAILKPRAGTCCVFCSYGSDPCPSVQLARQSW